MEVGGVEREVRVASRAESDVRATAVLDDRKLSRRCEVDGVHHILLTTVSYAISDVRSQTRRRTDPKTKDKSM